MRKIPYAGYDPAEGPLWEQASTIDTERAAELRRQGLTWRQVGERLAAEYRRRMPYTGQAVGHAVRRHAQA